MKILFYIFLLTTSNLALSQELKVKESENTPDSINNIYKPGEVHQAATYPDGQTKLMSSLAKVSTSDLNIQDITNSKLIIEFVIEKDGSTSNFTVLKSIHEGYDLRVIDSLKTMKFNPAKVDEKKVRSSYIIPIQICFD